MDKLPATPCICYEREILWEKSLVAMLRLVKSANIFKLEILGYTVVFHTTCTCITGVLPVNLFFEVLSLYDIRLPSLSSLDLIQLIL